MLESEAMLLAIFNFLKRAIFNWVLQRLVLTCPLQNLQMPGSGQFASGKWCDHILHQTYLTLQLFKNKSLYQSIHCFEVLTTYFKRCFPMAELRLLNGSLANVTVLRFAAMVPAGAIADAVGSTVRVPFVACRPEKVVLYIFRLYIYSI